MSTPEDNRSDAPGQAPSWGGSSGDETQVVRPVTGENPGYGSGAGSSSPYAQPEPAAPASGPYSQPSPAVGVNPEPPSYPDTASYGYGAPAYSAADSAATSVYPAAAPAYAPAGYPPAYAPAAPAVIPPAPVVLVAQPASRAAAGALSALIGLVLVAGGLFLASKYGFQAARVAAEQGGKTGVKEVSLTIVGALLLFAAVGLNGWSPWATVLPGLALAGLGGWAFVSPSGLRTVSSWSDSILSRQELESWHLVGFTMILGLVMLAASLAAALARSSGKTTGLAAAARSAG